MEVRKYPRNTIQMFAAQNLIIYKRDLVFITHFHALSETFTDITNLILKYFYLIFFQ